MLKSNLILFLLISVVNVNAQKIVPGTTFTQFSLKSKNDTIDFVVADTDLTVKKPVFLFVQGSLPIPLFVEFPGQGVFPMALGNFDMQNLKQHFHVVTISMPKIPVLVTRDHVNDGYMYITDSTYKNSIPDSYLKADYLENYVDRANKVLSFLRKQKWVDNSRLVVAGHSQGSRIVAELAATNPKITHAGLFGFSPLGRVHEQVWLNYKEFIKGNSSWEDYEAKQNQQLEFQKQIVADKGEDIGMIPWKSFTGIGFERLARIKTPLYIAYGTEDKCAFVSELIPFYFVTAGKTNYEMKRYNGLEHNYFPVAGGKVDYENGKWPEVMNAFVEWSLK
ncbi:alpha/beta hydrolase family protein [Fluviicola chungangensis]|uniref:Alpha/beta hydrolase n=1 Tax=Fluviicola chungangensis TaxID=2597671 RepID=A0A556N6N1_9FLAO|nr:hypothetical protein [Fluviicola chungangensis]TSJ47788.1 hypothetical protein FO442_01275 [Fluviicola chungangensis]